MALIRKEWIGRAGLAFLCAAAWHAGACADVLVGPKGERLPGKFVEERNGLIVFQSEFLGRIEVRADQAHVERGGEGGVAGAKADVPTSSPVASPRPATGWTADVGAKISIDRGSLKTREDKLDAGLKIRRRRAHGEVNSTLDYGYKRTDRKLKNDDWTASLAYDWFIAPERFLAGRVWTKTELADEGSNRTDAVSLAYGWRIFDTPDRYLRIGPSLGYVSLRRGDNRSAGPALGLYMRGRGPGFGRTTYEYELQALDALRDGRYGSLDLRWRKPLSERLYLALVWRYTWTDVEIESGFTSEWRWDIGWRFGDAEPH